MKNKREENPKSEAIKWFFTIFIVTFILSMLFSYISTTSIQKLNLIPAIAILIVVVFIGIAFDLVGVAVNCATEEDFHAMGSKKVKGAKTAIKLIRSAPKVSNICADVIGDICGVLSGAISAIIALKLTQQAGLPTSIQFIMSAIVASFTVAGKALGKGFAKNNCTSIIYAVAKILSIFEK